MFKNKKLEDTVERLRSENRYVQETIQYLLKRIRALENLLKIEFVEPVPEANYHYKKKTKKGKK